MTQATLLYVDRVQNVYYVSDKVELDVLVFERREEIQKYYDANFGAQYLSGMFIQMEEKFNSKDPTVFPVILIIPRFGVEEDYKRQDGKKQITVHMYAVPVSTLAAVHLNKESTIKKIHDLEYHVSVLQGFLNLRERLE